MARSADRHGLYLGMPFERFQQSAPEARRARGIRIRGAGSEILAVITPSGSNPRADLLQPDETLHQQRRAHQQHRGEGHLRDDDAVSQRACAMSRRSPLPCCASAAGESDARRAHGRHQPHDEPARDRQEHAERRTPSHRS